MDFLVQWQHPPADLEATSQQVTQQVVKRYEELITHLTDAAGSSRATATSSSKNLQGQQPWQLPSSQRQLQQGYKCAAGYLQQRLDALLQPGGVHVGEASHVGAQLLQLLQSCHASGVADEEVYAHWAEAAEQLHQHKVRGLLDRGFVCRVVIPSAALASLAVCAAFGGGLCAQR